jgi:hypothetical protein
VKGLRTAELLLRRSSYSTKPLEDALVEAFGNSELFGAQDKDSGNKLKVGVTAVSSTGSKAYLLSNYNTIHRATQPSYIRFRPQALSQEVKVWEA